MARVSQIVLGLFALLFPSAAILSAKLSPETEVGSEAQASEESFKEVRVPSPLRYEHYSEYWRVQAMEASSSYALRTLGSALRFDDKALEEDFCKSKPEMCKAPFDCHSVSGAPPMKTFVRAASNLLNQLVFESPISSEPELQAWCFAPQHSKFITSCVNDGKLAEAGYAVTESHSVEYQDELEASYCFLEGHCANRAINHSTTLQEATRQCNLRFKPEAGPSFSSLSESTYDQQELRTQGVMPADPRNGFKNRLQTSPFTAKACEMGHYHCDVMHCQARYCQDSAFIQKYGHFLDEYGWSNSHAAYM